TVHRAAAARGHRPRGWGTRDAPMHRRRIRPRGRVRRRARAPQVRARARRAGLRLQGARRGEAGHGGRGVSWNRVAVVGAGLIKFGELFEQSYEQMASDAFSAAVDSVDAGFEPEQVEAAIVATQRGTLWGQEGIGGNTIPSAIGLSGIPCTRVENACPSGSDAFRIGAMAVASGVHDIVLVIGVEKMRDKSTEEGLLSRAASGHPIFT